MFSSFLRNRTVGQIVIKVIKHGFYTTPYFRSDEKCHGVYFTVLFVYWTSQTHFFVNLNNVNLAEQSNLSTWKNSYFLEIFSKC